MDWELGPRGGAGAEAEGSTGRMRHGAARPARPPGRGVGTLLRGGSRQAPSVCPTRTMGGAYGFTLCCFPGALGILVLESQISNLQPAAPTSALAGCDLRQGTLPGLGFPICKMG